MKLKAKIGDIVLDSNFNSLSVILFVETNYAYSTRQPIDWLSLYRKDGRYKVIKY